MSAFATPSPATERRSGRIAARTLLLWASLAVNAFLIALVGAHLLRHPAPPQPGPEHIIARMAAVLPPPDAARFRATFAQDEPALDQAHARVEAARRATAEAIGRQPYDEAAVRAAMQAWRASLQDFATQFGNDIAAALRGVSAEGRQKLAAMTESRPEHAHR